MDITHLLTSINRLDGATKALRADDAQIVALVAFVCDALCDLQPGLRAGLMARLQERLEQEFYQPDADRNPSSTLQAGLEQVIARIRRP